MAAYIFVAVLCTIGGLIYIGRYPGRYYVYFPVLIAVLIATIAILSSIAKKKFKEEVLSHLDNCRTGIFLEELTKVMGKKRGKRESSFYASLCATGYDVLGDYDSLYASCRNIKLRVHMPVYHRRMFSYYISRNEVDHAKDALAALTALAAEEKNPAEKKVITGFEEECKRALQVHTGEYNEPINYYSEMLKSMESKPLVTRVSYAYALGSALVMNGDLEEAKEPLLFAASRGGDTKYRRQAEELLKKIKPSGDK